MKLKLLVLMMMMLVHSFVRAQQDSISLEDKGEDAQINLILDVVQRLPTLEELYELAYLNSPIFQSNKISNQIYRENIRAKKWDSYNLLTISPHGFVGNSLFSGESALIGVNSGGLVTSGFGVSFGFIIRPGDLGIKTRSLQIAKLELELFETEQRQAYKVLKAEISLAYFTLLTQSNLLSTTLRVNESTNSVVYLAEKSFLGGDISLSEYHTIIIEDYRMKLLVAETKIKVKSAFFKLKLLVGGSFE